MEDGARSKLDVLLEAIRRDPAILKGQVEGSKAVSESEVLTAAVNSLTVVVEALVMLADEIDALRTNAG